MNSEFSEAMQPPETLSFREKLRDIVSVAHEDLRSTNWRGKAIILGMIAMGAYEWGPGNETLAPIITGQSLDLADGLGGIAVTAIIGGGFVAGQQLLGGALARKNAQQFPSVAERAFSYMNDEEEEKTLKYKPFDDLSYFKQWLYAFSMGSTFVVSREALATEDSEDAELKHVSRKSSAISGSSVALLGTGIDIVNQRFDNNDLIQFGIDWGVKNPLFWVALVGGLGVYGHHKNKQVLTDKPS